MNKRFLSYLAVGAVTLLAACSQSSSPFVPDPVGTSLVEEGLSAGQPGSTPTLTPETTPTPSNEPDELAKVACSERYTATPANFIDGGRVPDGSTIEVDFKAVYIDPDQPVHLAVFQMFDSGPQELIDSEIESFGDQGERRFRVPLPDGCLTVQIDAGCGENIPENADYGDGAYSMFNDAWFVSTESCGQRHSDPDCSEVNSSLEFGVLNESFRSLGHGPEAASGYPVSVVVGFSKGAATLNWGDGNSETVSPGTYSHSYYGDPGEYTITLTVSYEGLRCVKTLTVRVPGGEPSCEDYEPPTITGDISSDVQATQVVFGSGNVGPAGGWFSPSLPQTVSRPDAGQPAGSFSTTYTLPYGPEQLECSVNQTFTKPVPPEEPCREEWIFISEEIEYGGWGECQQVNDVTASNGQSCQRTRTVTTVITEQNSCTEELRQRTTQGTESESCDCPITCLNTPATSGASQNFTLPDSGQATETAWVNANVNPGPYAFGSKDQIDGDQQCATAATSAPVVLLKAGTNYQYFLNVSGGQQLCSGVQQAISHLSYFICADD